MKNDICFNCGQSWTAHNPSTLSCPNLSGTSQWGITSFRAAPSHEVGGGPAPQSNPLDLTMDRMERLEIKRAAWQIVMVKYEAWINDVAATEHFDWDTETKSAFTKAQKAWEFMK